MVLCLALDLLTCNWAKWPFWPNCPLFRPVLVGFGRKKLDKTGFIQFFPFCPEETGFGRKKANPVKERKHYIWNALVIFICWPRSCSHTKNTKHGKRSSLTCSQADTYRLMCVLWIILMAQCKTAVSPLLTHWRYCSLALSHQYFLVGPPVLLETLTTSVRDKPLH